MLFDKKVRKSRLLKPLGRANCLDRSRIDPRGGCSKGYWYSGSLFIKKLAKSRGVSLKGFRSGATSAFILLSQNKQPAER